jgi:hypothetical protein
MVLFLPVFRDEHSGSISWLHVLLYLDALFVARKKSAKRQTEANRCAKQAAFPFGSVL